MIIPCFEQTINNIHHHVLCNVPSQIQPKVEELLDGNKFDAIICVAGGWAGGSAKSKGK